MIELAGVCKTYNLNGVRKTIFNNLNFVFPEGRNVAIVGENGSGKSTLMRLLAGAEAPDKGRIIRSSSISWPLGFTAAFAGSMTGLENARFVARVYGADYKNIIEQVEDFAELGKSLKLPISTYSSGMKARLAFGLSMSIKFDYYLIDEIIGVGDQNFRRKSKRAFKEILQSSQIIMASHSVGTIRSYCDCGLLLSREGAFYYDDINDLLSDYSSTTAT